MIGADVDKTPSTTAVAEPRRPILCKSRTRGSLRAKEIRTLRVRPLNRHGTDLMIAGIGGLFWTNAAILWRTATR
jgi:hypothetical protein